MNRTARAFLIAPLAPAVPFILVNCIIFLTSFRLDSLLLIPGSMAMVGLFTYPAALLLGLPAYVLFRRYQWVGRASHVTGGAVIGLISPALFVLGVTLFKGNELPDSDVNLIFSNQYLKVAMIAMFCGALSGFTFHFIAKPHKQTFSPIPTAPIVSHEDS